MNTDQIWEFLRNKTYNFYKDFYYGKGKYSGLVFILRFGMGKTRNITQVTKEWCLTDKLASTFLYTAPTHKLISQTIEDLSENDPHFAIFHRHIWGIEKLCRNENYRILFRYFPNRPTYICRKYCHLGTNCKKYYQHKCQWENEDYPTFLPHNYLQNYIPKFLKKNKFSSLLVDENCKDALKTVIRTSPVGYLKLGNFLEQVEGSGEKDFMLESYKAVLKNQPFKLSLLIEDFSFVKKRIKEFNDSIDERKLEIIEDETSEKIYKHIPNIPYPIFDLGLKLKKLPLKDRLNKLDTYMIDNSGLRFYSYVDIPSTSPIILLDTYDRGNQLYFPDHNFKIFSLKNEILLPNLKIYQDQEGNYPRASLYHPKTFDRKIFQIMRILDKFKGEKTLIGCCMGDKKSEDHRIEYKVKKALQNYTVVVEHYGNVAGMNDYTNFTVGIAFGTFKLSNDEIERLSKEEDNTLDEIRKKYEEFKIHEFIGRFRAYQRLNEPIKFFIFIRDFPIRSYYNIPDKNYFPFGRGKGYPSLFNILNPNFHEEFRRGWKIKRKIKKMLRENNKRMFLSDLKSSLPYDNNLKHNLLTELEGEGIIRLIKENRKTVGRSKKIVELLI